LSDEKKLSIAFSQERRSWRCRSVPKDPKMRSSLESVDWADMDRKKQEKIQPAAGQK